MKKLIPLFLCFLIIKLQGQNNIVMPRINYTPNGYFDKVYDRFGNSYYLDELSINDNIRSSAFNRNGNSNSTPTSLTIENCNGSYFTLCFEDGWFNGSDQSKAQLAKNTICQVLTDLSAFINSRLSTNNNKVNLWVRNINKMNVSNSILGVSSPFYLIPNAVNSSYSGGIVDDAVWKTIHTGQDAYSDYTGSLSTVSQQSANTFFHGVIAFDFLKPWNYNLTSFAANNEYDLYTIVLHEVIHLLGFNSLIDKAQKSILNNNHYNRYDRYLQNLSSVQLLNHVGNFDMYGYSYNNASYALNPNPCPITVNQSNSDITNCLNAVRYVSSFSQIVYTPSCFEEGISLSHFEDMCLPSGTTCTGTCNNRYFVMSNKTELGVTKRSLQTSEMQVLCDIGYSINNSFGNPSNIYFNYKNYGTSCGGISVSGINDGVLNNTYIYIGDVSSSILLQDGSNQNNANNFLFNDINCTGFEGLQIVKGSGTIVTTSSNNTSGTKSTTVNYIPASNSGRIHLLRYVPTNGIEKGNITYIFVYVNMEGCNTGSPCNFLVNNGNFENSTGCFNIGGPDPNPLWATLDCWEPHTQSPDIISRGCTNNNNLTNLGTSTFGNTPIAVNSYNILDYRVVNNCTLGLLSVNSSSYPNNNESVQTTLNQPLINGKSYTISFWGRVNNGSIFGYSSFQYIPANITFGSGTKSLPPNYSEAYPQSTIHLIPNCNFTIPNDNTWHYFSKTFIFDANNHTQLFLGNTTVITNTNENYIYIDDVNLQETNNYVEIIAPNTACIGDDIELTTNLPISNVNFAINGNTISQNSFGKFVYTPSNSGTFLITCNYISTNSCPVALYKYITINSLPAINNITSSSNSNKLCMNKTLNLSCSTLGGSWSSLNNNVATVSNKGLVTGLAPGNFNTKIKYEIIGTNGCKNNSTFDITVNPSPNLTTSAQSVATLCSSNSTVNLTAASTTPNVSFIWTTPINHTDDNLGTTGTSVQESGFTNYGSYSFTVTAQDPAGCTNTLTKNFTILSPYVQCNTINATSLPRNVVGSQTANGRYMSDGFVVTASPTATTFTNSEIIMSTNAVITVPNGATLKLVGCHLYGCDDMWQGIVVQGGGRLIIDGINEGGGKSSFIEDAKIAVDLTINATLVNSYLGKNPPIMLNVNNTVFNRNNIGIKITGGDAINLPASYISIGNTIFTSRKLPFNGLVWKNVSEVKTNANISYTCLQQPATLNSPYIDETLYSSNDCAAFLKHPYLPSTKKPEAGIKLSSAKFINDAITIGNPVVNGTNCNTTIFDNLGIGINISITPLNVKNCAFQNGWSNGVSNTGAGIYATNCSDPIIINTDINLNEPRNQFWDLQYAVKTTNCTNITVGNSDILSSKVAGATNTHKRGAWGIYVEGSKLDNVYVRSNTLTNIDNAINVNNTTPTGSSASVTALAIINNTIQADFSNFYTGTTQAVINAITIGSVNSYTTASRIDCCGNKIYKAYNGIMMSAWKGKNLLIDYNIIYLKQYTIGAAKQQQYGLRIEGGVASTATGNQITNNNVYGDFSNDANVPEQTGIYLTNQQQNFLACNTVGKLKDGFRFYGGNLAGTRFWYNNMKITNKFGYTLDQGGAIGNIGAVGATGNVLCTSDNVWEGTSAAWTANPNPLYKHYRVNCTNGSNAANSILFVKTGDAFNPDGAVFGTGLNIPYSSTTMPGIPKSIFVGNGSSSSCPTCPSGVYPPPPPPPVAQQQNQFTDVQNLEDIALLDINDPNNEESVDVIMTSQQQLYEMLKADPTLLSQSVVLQQFMADNSYSSIDYAYLTGNALSDGNYTLANALLNTWATDAMPDLNSYTYYTWLYNIQTDSTYVPDTLAILDLASKCPLTNGSIVHAARNLYNSLTGQIVMFDNSCENAGTLSRKAPTKPTIVTSKSLPIKINVYPNPTNGYVYIDLPNTTTDKVCWQISVHNAMSKQVQEKNIKTKATKTFVELKGASGIYFIKVLNCNTGNLSVQKVILQ